MYQKISYIQRYVNINAHSPDNDRKGDGDGDFDMRLTSEIRNPKRK